MFLIKNAKIMTMDAGKVIENGYILVEKTKAAGKILEVGSGSYPGPESDVGEVLDAGGAWLLPGLIDPHCHIGLWEDSQRSNTGDGNEMTDPNTAHLRAIDAINPLDKCFQEALEYGITSVMTGPGSANVIGGTFAFMKTYGKNIDEMTVKSDAAMKAALGENPKSVYGTRNSAPGTRMGNAAILRESLMKAKAYMEKKMAAEEGKEPELNLKYEALISVLEKKMVIKIHAHRADDILTAIRICNEFDLLYTLDHCTEGYLIAEYIEEEYAKGNLKGVIAGPLMSDRSKPELSGQSIKNPGILAATGVLAGIMTDHPVIPIQYLPVSAAVAAREGMDEDLALEAITCRAAEICGVDERVGSIKVGKDADLVLMDGHPFEFRSKVLCTLVDGKIRYRADGF